MAKTREKARVGGFFRLNITEEKDGKKVVVGDTGWKKNMITNLGVQHFIIEPMLATSGSDLISYAALGSASTAIASNGTALPSEITHGRFVVTGAVSASRTLRYVGTLASSVISGMTATTIGNIGLFADSTTGAGTALACATYATSPLAVNQAVNITYDLQFPTS